jgi:two-component system cell cycle sensor histidine kinase/response regulator CckA
MNDSSPAPVVLAVDDEVFVLNTVCHMLAYGGYTVLRAASADSALEIARSHTSPIDLVLTDVIMPRMSGPKLADCIAELHPEASYLFIAGLPDTSEIVDQIVRRGFPFLPKPFFAKTLLSKVHEVLSPRAMSAGVA